MNLRPRACQMDRGGRGQILAHRGDTQLVVGEAKCTGFWAAPFETGTDNRQRARRILRWGGHGTLLNWTDILSQHRPVFNRRGVTSQPGFISVVRQQSRSVFSLHGDARRQNRIRRQTPEVERLRRRRVSRGASTQAQGWFVPGTCRFGAQPRCENGCSSRWVPLAAGPHPALDVVAGAIDDAEVRR